MRCYFLVLACVCFAQVPSCAAVCHRPASAAGLRRRAACAPPTFPRTDSGDDPPLRPTRPWRPTSAEQRATPMVAREAQTYDPWPGRGASPQRTPYEVPWPDLHRAGAGLIAHGASRSRRTLRPTKAEAPSAQSSTSAKTPRLPRRARHIERRGEPERKATAEFGQEIATPSALHEGGC